MMKIPDHDVNHNTCGEWDANYKGNMDVLEYQYPGMYDIIIDEISDNLNILDVGGAAGVGAQMILDTCPNSSIRVIDISSIACEFGARNHPDVEFICSDIVDAELGNDVYDCIIASQVVEHVDDPHELIVRFMNALKVGGVLYIGLPHDDEVYHFHQYRYGHEVYHLLEEFSRWVSFADDGARRGNGSRQHITIRIIKE